MSQTAETGHKPSAEQQPAPGEQVAIRQALPADVRAIYAMVEPYAAQRILVAKDMVAFYEGVQEFVVAHIGSQVVGCAALHVLWDDLAEIRTVAVHPDYVRQGIGRQLVQALIQRARVMQLKRLFCLTFEVSFFTSLGFMVIEGTPVTTEVFHELLRSQDEGVAEFLDLARVKPNTLGNTRVLLTL